MSMIDVSHALSSGLQLVYSEHSEQQNRQQSQQLAREGDLRKDIPGRIGCCVKVMCAQRSACGRSKT